MNNRYTRCILLAALALGVATLQPLTAQQMEPLLPHTVHVQGVGEIEVAPDQAEISLAVETVAASAREAGEMNARSMEQVIRALVAAGVPRTDIETRNYSVFPEYDYREQEAPRIRGYRATNQVGVETTKLDDVGRLIDTALQAGANRVEGVNFGLRDEAAARATALRQAVANARAAAETMAAALGVRLGEVVYATTDAMPMRPSPVMLRAAAAGDMAESAPTPIQPGEQRITARATVTWAILQTPR